MRGFSAEFRVLKSMVAGVLKRFVEVWGGVRGVLCEVRIQIFNGIRWDFKNWSIL
jgi:hypothetical protein